MDRSIFTVESNNTFSRLSHWIRVNLGEQNSNYSLFWSSTSKGQKESLYTFFRLVCCCVISADLSQQVLHHVDTIKEWINICFEITEKLLKNCASNNTQIQQDINKLRTKLRSLVRLFQFVSSTDYIEKLVHEDKELKLGALTLHLWGETLLLYCETSLCKYWKPQCMEGLTLAEDKLMKCLVLSPNRHQSAFLLGNCLLLKARTLPSPPQQKESLVLRSYKFYSFVNQLLPSFPAYLYPLAKVCCFLGKENECEEHLKALTSTRPSNILFMLSDADFDQYKGKRWYLALVDAVSSPNSTTQPPAFDDKRYNLLQNSLLESGFSMKKLLELINWLPVSTGQSQLRTEEDSDHVRKQKERLQQRLELYQLKPKRDIPGDGNCQMHAISDQLYDTISKSADIRKMVVDWLQKNRDWQLPNGAIFHQFVHDRPWDDYCNAMAKDGCWGDHLTLMAISELFGAQISIFSSVEGDNFITEIHPTTKKYIKLLKLMCNISPLSTHIHFSDIPNTRTDILYSLRKCCCFLILPSFIMDR